MDNFDSTYSILNEINGSTGLTYDSVFSICMAIYEKLGGTKTEDQFDSVYSLVIDIKEILPSGGGGGEGMEQLEDIYTYLYHQEPPVGATAESLKVLIENAIDALNSTISSQAATITAQTQEIATKDATIASQEATITSQTAEINNYSSGTANSYTAAANKGATIPQQQTIDNLPSTISSIPQAKPEEQLTETISSNGTTSYSPTAGSVFSGATITVDVPLAEKSISTNGTYYATGDNASGYSKVVVSCPEPKTEDQLATSITTNNTYTFTPTSGHVYSGATIEVNVQPSLQSKSTNINGTITADTGYYGLSSVTVNVPEQKPEEALTQTISANGTTSYSPTAGSVFSGATITVDIPLAEKSISTNGTYYATGDNASGYSKVVVSCPEPKTEEHGSHTFQSNTVTPYRIEPTSGNVFDYVDVTVNVQPNVGTKSITQNGTYNASSDSLDGYSSVSVNVPERKPEETCTETITQNGTTTYTPTSGSVFDEAVITVNVQPPLQTKSITSPIATVTADTGYYGLSQVNVNVPITTKTIEHNGTYNASSDNAEGYSSVTVSVPLGTKSISTNGTYNASSDNLDGFSSVTVSCPEPKPEETLDKTGVNKITTNGTYNYTPTSGYVYDEANITVDVQPNVGTKSITLNGTYNASSDSLDGYSSVSVNVPSSGGFDTSQLQGFQLDYSLSTIDYGGFVAGDNFKLRDANVSASYTYVPRDINISSYTNLDRADFSKVTYVGRGAFPTKGDSINLSNLRFTNCVDFGYYSSDSGPFSYYMQPSYGSVQDYLYTTVKYIYMDNMVFRDLASGGTTLSYITHKGLSGSVATRFISMTGTTLENVTSLYYTFRYLNTSQSDSNLILGSTQNVKNFIYTFEGVGLATNYAGAAAVRSVIENLDTSSAEGFKGMLSGGNPNAVESGSYRYSLDLTGWNTSNVSSFGYLFVDRKSLQTLDLTGWSATSVVSAYNISTIFQRMSDGVTYDRTIVGSHTEAEAEAGTIKVFDDLHVAASFDTTYMGYLNRASLLAIINGLRDMTGETGLTLTIGSTALAKLTTDDIAKATAKNWTLA